MTNNTISNFGRNVSFTPAAYTKPKNEQEVLQLLQKHRDQNIRVVASRHGWSDGIRTDGLLIDVQHLNQVTIDKEQQTVRVGAGCKIKHLLQQLKREGLTLPSLGLIDEQTVAGATANGTHGSGKHSLSHYIRRVRVAHYDSETGEPTVSVIESGRDLLAGRCSLGLLGVILEIEFTTRPTYNVQEHSKFHRSLESVLTAEKEYPLQQFFLMPWSWQWIGQHRIETDQPRSRFAGLYQAYWHLGIDWGLHLVMYLLVKILRARILIRSFYRFLLPLVFVRNLRVTDDSHSLLTMEHELFRHIEIEFFVTRSKLEAALRCVKDTMIAFSGQPQVDSSVMVPEAQIGTYCHHYPICVRRILSDETLLSMASPVAGDRDEDWYSISIISIEWPNRREGFVLLADFLASLLASRFDARCHWGKYNPLDRTSNERLYPKLEAFRNVVDRFDPQGHFANQWLRDVVLAETFVPITGDAETA